MAGHFFPPTSIQTPISLFPSFPPLPLTTHPHITLRITKSLSAPTSFSIVQVDATTSSSTPLLHIQEKVPSLHARKEVFDKRTGALVCEIVREQQGIGQARRSWVVSGYGGREVMRVREGGGRFDTTTSVSATISLSDGTQHRQQQREILLQSNYFDTRAEIVDPVNHLVLARIDRKFLSGRVIFSSLKYTVRVVVAGVDLVLVAVLCVCAGKR